MKFPQHDRFRLSNEERPRMVSPISFGLRISNFTSSSPISQISYSYPRSSSSHSRGTGTCSWWTKSA
jgi:hypothetical protein